jgi:hypothetical protein
MNHAFQLSDETYEVLRELASEEGKTPASLVTAWVAHQIETRRQLGRNSYTDPHYCTTDEWFRHLGTTDEEIAEADCMMDDDEAAE